jgi:hypothetical protein
MSRTLSWPCDITTEVSGNLSRLEASQGNHSKKSPLPLNLLQKICSCARIDATFSTNHDRITEITLVNNGSSDVLQRVKLSVISSIIERAVFRKSPEQIEEAAKKANLEKVISWKIYDFTGEGPGQPLCLFIYSRKDLRYLPLTSFDRIDTDGYHRMMGKFQDSLK